eukprot:768192-Hanusia_phi.AAC.2
MGSDPNVVFLPPYPREIAPIQNFVGPAAMAGWAKAAALTAAAAYGAMKMIEEMRQVESMMLDAVKMEMDRTTNISL